VGHHPRTPTQETSDVTRFEPNLRIPGPTTRHEAAPRHHAGVILITCAGTGGHAAAVVSVQGADR
jgi:hypothetical protein